MAKSTHRPPKKPTPINSSVALEEPPPDIQAEIPPAFQPPAADDFTKSAQPVYEEVKPPPAKTLTFEQTMNKIPKADWGPLAIASATARFRDTIGEGCRRSRTS